MHYRQSGDALWILLSILILPIDKQIEVIGGLTDNESEVKDKTFVSNSMLLANSLYCYGYSWIDQGFDFLYDFVTGKPSQLQESFLIAVSNTAHVDTYKKDFINSIEWFEVRCLGQKILEKSGLPPYPLLGKIDFNEFLEIVVDPKHGLVCINR